jgi:hypothetical protein
MTGMSRLNSLGEKLAFDTREITIEFGSPQKVIKVRWAARNLLLQFLSCVVGDKMFA